MRCEAERDAAVFLGGTMSGPERAEFGRHLLTCADCWTEVDAGRRGRSLAESARTAAPPQLRDRVRGLVEAEGDTDCAGASSARARRRWWRPVSVSAAAAVAVTAVVVWGGGTTEPPSLRRAVADFSAERLPGTQLPEERAPDLSGLQLQPAGAGGGAYAELDVDGFAYQDATGRRVVLYLSDDPFPEAPGARQMAGADGPWIVRRGDVVMLCARLPHAMLVVGEDEQLVRSAAGALGVL